MTGAVFRADHKDYGNPFTMNSSGATMVNSMSHLKQWQFHSGSSSYQSCNNSNNFDSFGQMYGQTPVHCTVPNNSFQPINERNFQSTSGDYAVSSSLTSGANNLVQFINGFKNTSPDNYSEDTWSNATPTPDSLVSSIGEDIHYDDNNVAHNSAPLLRNRLTQTAADEKMSLSNWQNYQQNHQQIQPKPSLPESYQQYGQFQRINEQFPQYSQFSEYGNFPQFPQNIIQKPHYSQVLQYNQCQFHNDNQRKPCPYPLNTNYFVENKPNYQAIHQQEVGLRMAETVAPLVSASGNSPPLDIPISSTIADSHLNQMNNTASCSILAIPTRKKAVSRIKINRSLPMNETDRKNTVYHECPVCKRLFRNRSNIKAHKLTHTGEKPFACKTCNKEFRQKAHLQKHEVTHRKQKN